MWTISELSALPAVSNWVDALVMEGLLVQNPSSLLDWAQLSCLGCR